MMTNNVTCTILILRTESLHYLHYALLCKNSNSTKHRNDINTLYFLIIAAIQLSAKVYINFSIVSNKRNIKPNCNNLHL